MLDIIKRAIHMCTTLNLGLKVAFPYIFLLSMAMRGGNLGSSGFQYIQLNL